MSPNLPSCVVVTEMTRRYARIIQIDVRKSECKLAVIVGNARRTMVTSREPMSVPRTTMARTRLLCVVVTRERGWGC